MIDASVSIEWVDRETLRYSMAEYSVLVWVDYEPGLFNNARIIKASSIVRWDKKPDNASDLIDEQQRQKICKDIEHYYRVHHKKCRVEN